MSYGSGGDASGLAAADQAKGSMPDQFDHEIATAFDLKGKGVVPTSCSHRGIVDAVAQARGGSAVEKIHAAVGGRLTRAAMSPDDIVPLHCTGEVLDDEARAAMPGKVVRGFIGTRLVFDVCGAAAGSAVRQHS